MRVHRLYIPKALCKLIEAGVWPDANTPARGFFEQDINPILGEQAAHALSPDDDHIVMLPPPFFARLLMKSPDGGIVSGSRT